jgi:hypothetical protein
MFKEFGSKLPGATANVCTPNRMGVHVLRGNTCKHRVRACHVRSAVKFLSGSAQTQQYSQRPSTRCIGYTDAVPASSKSPQTKAELLTRTKPGPASFQIPSTSQFTNRGTIRRYTSLRDKLVSFLYSRTFRHHCEQTTQTSVGLSVPWYWKFNSRPQAPPPPRTTHCIQPSENNTGTLAPASVSLLPATCYKKKLK